MTTSRTTVTTAGLGRALLGRQHLLERASGEPVPLVRHLVGLQSQNPPSPYLALRDRLTGFAHADLSALVASRRVVRLAVMRSTVHLVAAEDAHVLAALSAPRLRRDLRGNADRRADLEGTDVDAVAADARGLLEDAPRTAPELGAALAARGHPGRPDTLAMVARCLLPLVQLPPRGEWRRSGRTTWTTVEAALGPGPDLDLADPAVRDSALGVLVERYLAAYGPATVADAQSWSGLTGLQPVVDALGDRLRRVRHERADDLDGAGTRPRELLDVPGAPLPDADVPAPVRLLPDFDDVLLAHADRTRIVPAAVKPHLASKNGMPPPTVLVDGRVAGGWRVERERSGGRGSARRETAVLRVTPWTAWTPAQRDEVVAEAEAVVRFWADDADGHRVDVDPPAAAG
ncbi:winged helix DNA-binding domain-containing protein [Cellulomonas endophytica]|uniref:winged helix DNA-binding domain-containing protein n=1 Tax=Cellulomonas endophytica TaxID=2494735 RepID=UPI001F0BF737|nr:winged helix DNA-binding domain-containing protein [Cellulomonas endophytica]